MNLDGSMSHENKSEKGDPPKKVLKKLKEKTQFDYKEVRQDFMKNDDISIGGGMFRTCTIYTDGTVEVGNVCYYNLDPNELSMELQVKDAKFSSFFSGWIFENWFLPFSLPFISPIPLTAGTVF